MKSTITKPQNTSVAAAAQASSVPAKRKRKATVKFEFDLPAQGDVVEPAARRTRSATKAKAVPNALQEPVPATPAAKTKKKAPTVKASAVTPADLPENPTVADLVDSIRDVAAYARLTYRELAGIEHGRDVTNETNDALQTRLNDTRSALKTATSELAEANKTIATLRQGNDALMSQLMQTHADLAEARSHLETHAQASAAAASTGPVFFEDEAFDLEAFLKG